MSLAIVHTRAALGVNAPPITIEVHISNGLPGLTMVGPTGNHGKRGA
ncbi:putative ATP-dependent protease [Salmonella enterica subsp. enterica serovar Typhimurium]|nr:putative ATP-dependent protease [Salmonella enterica subsp. enterica serovar Typhimurium]